MVTKVPILAIEVAAAEAVRQFKFRGKPIVQTLLDYRNAVGGPEEGRFVMNNLENLEAAYVNDLIADKSRVNTKGQLDHEEAHFLGMLRDAYVHSETGEFTRADAQGLAQGKKMIGDAEGQQLMRNIRKAVRDKAKEIGLKLSPEIGS